MTPEIARGLSDLDEKSDIFALGILLFEMLTLHPFLEGDDITEIKTKLLEEPYRLPESCTGPENPQRLTGNLHESTPSVPGTSVFQREIVSGGFTKVQTR